MTIKEALENLTYCVNGMERKEKYYKIIKKDLDRLEKLEKVIEILKENLHISFVKEPIYPNCANYYINQYNKFGNGCLTIITKEQYELLKEVLRND